jgi:hypothetical protein
MLPGLQVELSQPTPSEHGWPIAARRWHLADAGLQKSPSLTKHGNALGSLGLSFPHPRVPDAGAQVLVHGSPSATCFWIALSSSGHADQLRHPDAADATVAIQLSGMAVSSVPRAPGTGENPAFKAASTLN